MNARGYDLPLASVTKGGGVEFRADLDVSVWNPSDDTSHYKRVCPGDFVIGLRSFQSGVGYSLLEGLVSPAYTVLRPVHPEVHGGYFKHLLKSRALVSLLENVAQGIRQGRTIAADDFFELRLPLPPVSSQQAIADFLDGQTARIDALITKKRRMVQLIEERHRTSVRTRMRDLSLSHGEIPLKRLVVCLDSRRIPLSGEERSERPGPYPYYGASGQIDAVDDYLFDETLVLLGEDGAQLADPDYEIAYVTSGPVWVNNHAHVLRPVGADPMFLAMHLSTVDRLRVISGSTREKITQSDMSEIPVPNVALDQQRAVSQLLRRERSSHESTVQRLRRQLDLFAEHRQALVAAAVSGELEVPGVAA